MIEWHLELKAQYIVNAPEITFGKGLRQILITRNEDINANEFSLCIFNFILCEVALQIKHHMSHFQALKL